VVLYAHGDGFMKKCLASFLAGIIVTISIAGFALPSLTAYYNEDIRLRVDGEFVDVTPITAIEGSARDGFNLFPVRKLGEALGYKVDFANKIIDLNKPSVEDVAKNAESCVMIVVYKNGKVDGTGSGVVYGDYIISNKHVLDNGDEFGIAYEDSPDGMGYKTKERISVNTDLDIAILKAPPNTVHKSVELGDSDTVKKGQQIVTISSPDSHKNAVLDGMVTDKVYKEGINYIQTTSETDFGSSGGALFNMDGELIGVIESGDDINMSFAISINQIKPILENLK
jgi:S1-C subfamily serine protease